MKYKYLKIHFLQTSFICTQEIVLPVTNYPVCLLRQKIRQFKNHVKLTKRIVNQEINKKSNILRK